jgi:glycosyltransferase involved in cell wall biosynthesis
MRILTFGWDFPPLRNGGLGVACYGLTEELINEGTEVIFVLPRVQPVIGRSSFRFALQGSKGISGLRKSDGSFRVIEVGDIQLLPYRSGDSPVLYRLPDGRTLRLDRSVMREASRYASAAAQIAREETFDIIHAHDWTSYLAGLAAHEVSGKPLILHVHATSYDQAGGENVDPDIFKIEQEAFAVADTVVAVSGYTRTLLIERYGVAPEKIEVVHNGIFPDAGRPLSPVLEAHKKAGKKIVAYLGRITIQKGIVQLVRSARLVVDHYPNVVFVIAGEGDMLQEIIRTVGAHGLSKNFIFAYALWDEERDRLFQSADLIVMPSVSEPFGIVPLEAMQQGTPVLVSKQSGASEVLAHALKVDFWDTEEMANKIVAVLKHPALYEQLVREGREEVKHITWNRAAKKISEIYRKLLVWFQRKGTI